MKYHPLFCEENVWHLCGDDSLVAPATCGAPPAPIGERRALFVTNRPRKVATWMQEAAPPGEPVLWDYHVVMVGRTSVGSPWLVFDLDSRLPFPVPLGEWLDATFPAARIVPGLVPRFRLVEAADFLRLFSSDRSHMLDEHRAPVAPFPQWPPISVPGIATNLGRFLDLDDPFVGGWHDLEEMQALSRGTRTMTGAGR